MRMASLPQGGEDEVFAPPPSALYPLRGQGRAFAAVAVGGVLGALARYGIGLLLPHPSGSFPWGTLLINVLGGLLMGALIVTVAERGRGHPLTRPFLGTGVLGGFTTFSTYTVDAQQLIAAGRVGVAGAYLAGTLVAAVVATWVGLAAARRVLR
jgi:fluoride exporter